MENTLENKRRFSSLYYGQKVYKTTQNNNCPAIPLGSVLILNPNSYLELKPLSMISDDDIEEVLRLAHNFKTINSLKTAIKREKDIIHCWYASKDVGAEYHVCLNFKYATVNCNLHFKELDGDKASNHKVNIGEIHFSDSRVVGYIQIVDFLRSKGYALPYMGLSVEKMIEYGWIKLKIK